MTMHMLINPGTVVPHNSGSKAAKGSGTISQGSSQSNLFGTLTDLYPMPVLKSVVSDFLLSDSVNVFYGKPKSGKSFLMIDLACSVATGIDWMGHSVTEGSAVYIGLEGRSSLPDRVLAWETDRSSKPNKARFWKGGSLNAFNDAEITRLITSLKEIHQSDPISLVIIDPLSRIIAGSDENSSATMSQVVDVADRIRKATGAAVVVVHHVSKSSEGSSPRGHGALLCAVDAAILVKPHRKNFAAKMTDARDLPEGRGFSFTLKPVPITRTDQSTGNSCVAELIPPSAAGQQTQVQMDADSLAEALRQVLEENGATDEQSDGPTILCGNSEDLERARSIFVKDRQDDPEQEEAPDDASGRQNKENLGKRASRAQGKLVKDKRLKIDGDDITLNLPSDMSNLDPPF